MCQCPTVNHQQGMQDAKTGQDALEPGESVSGQIDADTGPGPARKKPRHTQDLPELLTSAVAGGWLPDSPATLAKLEIVEHALDSGASEDCGMQGSGILGTGCRGPRSILFYGHNQGFQCFCIMGAL